MITILAHHLEPHHLGIAFALFGAGSIAGWMICAQWLAGRSRDHHAT